MQLPLASQHSPPALVLLATLAATAPGLLAWNVAPSPTFLNQALALALWGAFVVVARPAAGAGAAAARHGASLLLALALIGLGVLWSWGPGALPVGMALSAGGLLAAAALLVLAGAAAHAGAGPAGPARLFGHVCVGLAVAGVANLVIALVQVFAPGWADGDWIAASGFPGRAVGNLRQPNHLSSLLMGSAIAVVALVELKRLAPRAGTLLFTAMVFGVVLTASRTGTVGMLLLAAWGLADRRLSRPTRGLLLAAPLVYALAWFGMAEWAKLADQTFGGAARLSEAESPNSRLAIWANTLALVRMHPWTGVGFGEFNFAWTLTAFPGRPTAFFDHTHNLPLHLAVELGLPLALAVCAALVLALVQPALRARREAQQGHGDTALARRVALGFVLLIGLHSLLEYPLWYAYFLLPTAWVWGFALGPVAASPAANTDSPAPAVPDADANADANPKANAGAGGVVIAGPAATPRVAAAASRLPAAPSRAFAAGGIAMVVAAAFAVADYRSVAAVFAASAVPLELRIARGQHSLLFPHHADYAAATSGRAGSLQPFERATHHLLDTRLMIAWATALERAGDPERAAWLVARLREFRRPESDAFFARCADAAAADAFPCRAPRRHFTWLDFTEAGLAGDPPQRRPPGAAQATTAAGAKPDPAPASR